MTKFKPMLAEKADIAIMTFPRIASPKIDGIRCTVMPETGAVSRKLLPIPNDSVRAELNAMGLSFYDGELVTFTDGTLDSFNTIQSKIMSKAGSPDWRFMAFDHWGETNAPYVERLDALQSGAFVDVLMTHQCDNVSELVAFEEMCIQEGHEGIMSRTPGGRYKFGRSTALEGLLLKHKRFHDAEGVITGFKERLHNTNELSADELGHAKRSKAKAGMMGADTLGAFEVDFNGVAFDVGTGEGLNDESRARYWAIRESLRGESLTFKYQELSKDGVPRFPTFSAIRHKDI